MEEEIYKSLIKGVRKPKNKVALLSCGASGAGKSTSRNRFVEDAGLNTTFITLNMDDFWKYKETHEEARKLYRSIVTRVHTDGYSFLFDATCRNVSDIKGLIRLLKEKGYTVKLSITYAKLKTVMDRLRKRTAQPIRPSLALDIYNEVKHKIESMMKEPVDEIYLYDNESTTRLVYHKTANKISCYFPESDFYFDVSKYC